MELQVNRQSLKSKGIEAQCAHLARMTEAAAAEMRLVISHGQDHSQLEAELNQLLGEMHDGESETRNVQIDMKLRHDRAMVAIRNEFENRLIYIQQQQRKKMATERDEQMEKRRKHDLGIVDRTKNEQIKKMMTENRERVLDIRNYFADITKSLFERIELLKVSE
eukprot:GHVU01208014.1.p1 GENE.GHVU01208014.1~~GHVU01208014.1.p1  ORF type:complete len:165 (+),score=42.75 GHVU01208014.1:227-721(+)